MNKKRPKALEDAMTQDRHWHLDRRVPLAMILAIGLQTSGVIWWGSSLNERVNQLEQRAVVMAPQSDRITRMEVKLENIEKFMVRIERFIEPRTQ
jgi:hypothetical protein